MKFTEAQFEFIQLWGNFGSQWGINKTMAQVHALLLTSDEALSTDDIMENLSISRGGANVNLRELMVWNLVYKSAKPGDRKEFFVAEKDMWEVAKRITRERKRREIEPLMHHLNRLKNVDEADPKSLSFVKMVGDIERLVSRMDKTSDALMKAEENAFFGSIIRLLK
ncbi:MAG: transcriptional regulator [Crocinitomicaceae bacterium]|nr:transcriptional regulator [Flavobacteriales bacterium]NQZ34357.1 transcriptional regulator [Crocinitomicaceae bacterium]